MVILDLCGGTGNWSAPYKEAGYDVRVVDPQEWLGGIGGTGDARLFRVLRERVHGVLAAPPCTHFASSGARWWMTKGEAALLDGLSVADACLRIVLVHKPAWWALENPVGRLVHFYGPPRLSFNPCDYGDPYTKRTLLWGDFTLPTKSPVLAVEGSKVHRMSSSWKRQRSATPPGFARAFFEANP